MTPKQLLSTACFLAAMSASSSLFAQVKVGSNPTTIGANSNLEVEATAGQKVIVNKSNGTVVIQNTPTGAQADKIMTVDASGNVRAIDRNTLKQLLGNSGSAIMTRTSNQTFSPATMTQVNFPTTVLDEENGVLNSVFIAQRAGVYTLSSTMYVAIPGVLGQSDANFENYIQKRVAGSSTWVNIGDNQVRQNSTYVGLNTLTLLDNANVGDSYRVVVYGCMGCIPNNPDYTLTKASFYVFKNL